LAAYQSRNAAERGMSQRPVKVGPDPRLVLEILRLAVAPVEPGEGAEQAGIPLRRHDGVELGEAGRIEAFVGSPRRALM